MRGPLPPVLENEGKDTVQSRMVSLLGGQPRAKVLDLPRPASGDPRPFEVVGIPLPPGFHVVEIASPMLGRSLLDERHGAARTMYVRTSALVTNLGVHFKLGRENAAAWVTTLDKGQVVPGAVVRVSGCDGRELATATTDAQGIARFEGPVAPAALVPGPRRPGGHECLLRECSRPGCRRHAGHGLHLERLAARHRAVAFQRAHEQPARAGPDRAHHLRPHAAAARARRCR